MSALVLPAAWGSWRVLVLLSSVPILLACLGTCIMDESPAWLLDQGNEEKAVKVLRIAAAVNGKDIAGMSLVPCVRDDDCTSIKDLLSSRLRRRTVTFSVFWLFSIFAFYGSSFANPYIFGATNGRMEYKEVFFASSGELLGLCVGLAAMRYLSIPTSMSLSFFAATSGCLTILAVSLGQCSHPIILGVAAFTARAGLFTGTNFVWLVTPQAYPTCLRATAHGVLSGLGRVGGLLATVFPPDAPLDRLMAVYASASAICAATAFVERHMLDGLQMAQEPRQQPECGEEALPDRRAALLTTVSSHEYLPVPCDESA
eukprot:gnl/TRDRNA2_/TRDRNA2_175056_c0_seq5.p1 gnl/TRDRNA2_/TRDRNA2_175056_c0~~gnl/TRDRNA2_/TRDRNA2_175056_c0_seq5.p1  ORF type:complete len:325 (+),score=45.56 gnl/TRDRNA2_/TRDRNA2_175056_c0_seq5:32-976(+)